MIIDASSPAPRSAYRSAIVFHFSPMVQAIFDDTPRDLTELHEVARLMRDILVLLGENENEDAFVLRLFP